MEHVNQGGNVDVSSFTPQQMNTLRRVFHAGNRFMVLMWKMGWGKSINIWPAGFGRIMIIKHRGRKSGREYLTPVNYAIVDGEIYCAAGFGSISDWYRNMLACPKVELWLPEGKMWFCAEDISDSPRRLFLLRQVIIASGFAGPLFGINPKKMDDARLDAVSKDYRIVHFIRG
jgi:deazaflavin-dependent oxidoreductase (nitroreductase family)